MPDVLKQTLYWTGTPTDASVDVNGTGGSYTGMTAAQSKDGQDNTYAQATTTGDGAGTDGMREFTSYCTSANHTACSYAGAISFVRFIIRAKWFGTGASGTVKPNYNQNGYGTSATLTNTDTNYSWDFATVPSDSSAWTQTKLTNMDMGFEGIVDFQDAYSPNDGHVRVSEFRVEIYGPSVEIISPTSAAAVGAASTGSLITGLVAHAVPASSMVSNASNPTVVPISVSLPMVASTIVAGCDDFVLLTDAADPQALVNQPTFIDSGSTPVTVRSNTAPYADLSLATRTLLSSPGTWPNSGSLTFNFGGLNATTSIDGYGVIAGVKCIAMIRPRKDTNATLNNFRFIVGGTAHVLNPQPTIGAMPPATVDYQKVESPLITDVSGNAFEWGSGANSLFTRFVGWQFACDYAVSGAYAGQFAQCEVAEAWLEVFGYAGSEVIQIDLKQPMPNIRKIQTVVTTISN